MPVPGGWETGWQIETKKDINALGDSSGGPSLTRATRQLYTNFGGKCRLTSRAIAKWLAGIGILLTVFMVGLGAYGVYLSGRIEERFSGRRWQVPSTVYSDTTLLYPGQQLNLKALAHKLRQLGYQNVVHRPSRRGELRMSAQGIEIFLNNLNTPVQSRPGFPVLIRLNQDRIVSILRQDDAEPLPILEIEPEELAQFFGSEQERRQLVSIQQVPGHLVYAVLAAEDNRFF